ncbi:MAG: fused MFS/spermidine synthase [Pontiellaceae bacterium]
MKTISLFAICLLFYFSGIAALTYEVLWVRHLGLIFGNTVYAAATVMMTYMFGLAIGSHYAGKLASLIKKPVKVFGFLEIATALYALSIPYIFDFIQYSYRFAAVNISDSIFFLTFVRVLLALILLLIPTAMMGATLPVLAKGFLNKIDHFGSRLGLLYGINTLGAVSGVLLAGFLFIPKFGMNISNLIAVSLDLLVGIIAVGTSYFYENKLHTNINKPISIVRKRTKLANWLLISVGISGFISLAMEIIWFRALILIFGSTTYSFSAMLGIFLIGLSGGSLLISFFADKIKNPGIIFGISSTLIGFYTLGSLYFFSAMPEFLLNNLMLNTSPTWEKMISLKFLISIFFLLIPTLLFGVSFTMGVKVVRNQISSSSETVGEAAMFNTIGAALGAFFGGFILLPNIGMRYGLIICSILIIGLGVSLLYWFIQTKQKKIFIPSIVILITFLFLINPPTWNKKIISSGPYFSPWEYVKNNKIILSDKLESERLLFYNEGITSTISVFRDLGEDLQYASQGKVEADTTERSMMLQRMMGHLPMLFHPNPQRVVNIGLGAGVTFGAVSCYPAKHLEVVEFEPSVVNVAKIWKNKNHNVINNPNIKITINDGRNHLFINKEPYDVITSDPFEPVMAGAANLYTVDFFELAKSRLATNGIMAQYLPLYELSYEDYQMIMRSFAEVFPDCIIFFTGFDSILLGGKNENTLHLPIAEKKFEITQVRESLSEIGFNDPEMLLSMYVARLSNENKIWDQGNLNSDNNPYIEFSAPKSTFYYTPDENQGVLLKHYSSIPEELMDNLSEDKKQLVLDSHKAMKIMLSANIQQARETDKLAGIELQDLYQVTKMLQQASEISPNNPVIANELCANLFIIAESSRERGLIDDAFLGYNEILKYKKTEFWPILQIFNICMEKGDLEKASYALQYGLESYPNSPLFLGLKGKFIASTQPNRLDEGLVLIKQAIETLPEYKPLKKDYEMIKSLKR